MKKVKNHCFVCFWVIAVCAIAVQPFLFGQDYLSRDRENEIKMSGQYYWGEGSYFVEDSAKMFALNELCNFIIQDAVGQSEHQDEILKEIKMDAHVGRLLQQGKIKILAWIAKDSVLLTVTTQRPITRYEPQSVPVAPAPVVKQKEESVSQPKTVPALALNPVATDNPVLRNLVSCKTYNDVRRVATMNGLVRGSTINSSEGFSNPEKCIIAVFTVNGTLTALLDTGDTSRTDLLSGTTIQNPEQYYNKDSYFLWYLQQKKN